jgi:hypothetical protein
MRRMREIARTCCAAAIACFIAACGGGGGGGGGDGSGSAGAPPAPPPPRFFVSPQNVNMGVSSPNEGDPFVDSVTTTFEGIDARQVFVRTVVTGTAVTRVSYAPISSTQGKAPIEPVHAVLLGPGTHLSTITFIACTTDPSCSGPQLAGSPATINVTYVIGPVPSVPDAVAPAVGTAGVAGVVTLRGTDLRRAVFASFATTGATDVDTFLSGTPTEIRVSYPALPAGTHPITLSDVLSNPVPFTGSLHIVDAAPLPAATLAYPFTLQHLRGFVYDAKRQAIIVGAGLSTPAEDRVFKYPVVSGAWRPTPDILQFRDLRDITMALDGDRLLAITDTALWEIPPVTLVPLAPALKTMGSATQPDDYLKAIVAANDGQAVVLSGSSSSGQLRLYDIAKRTFSPPRDTYFHPVAGGSANGARIFWFDSGLGARSPAHQYLASFSQVTPTGPDVLQHFHPDPARVENINPPVVDSSGSRILVAGVDGSDVFHGVFDLAFNELGRVPSAGTAAYVLASNGARAYVLELGTGICRVRAFDLGVTRGAGLEFPEINAGFPIDLMPQCPASRPDTPIRMLLNPPGNTLFIAGNLLIRVVPLQ